MLNRNTVYKKEHHVKKTPLLPYVIGTGILNLIGLAVLIYGVFH
ncbi:hypothetical protein ACFQ5I_09550 [Companilactobacillus mishanensis]